MKYLFTLSFLSLYILTFGQKNNYNSFISYDDEYLDKILHPQRYISSASDYLFYGKIKNVYIEQLDGNGKISGTPAKSFFDVNKNTTKRINYNTNLKDYGVVEFFYFPKYGGQAVFKSSYEIQNGETKNNLTSEIDTINHIIINKKFINNQLSEIDTIFYINDYKPIEIRTNSVKYIDKSIKKIAYLENGKIYKEVYKRNSSSFGNFIKYNDVGKRLYLYKINFEEFENIPIDYEDGKKIEEQKFIWKNEKDFEFRENINSVEIFNYKEKKLQKTEKESSYTTFFNEYLLPVKKLSIDKKYGLNMEITFEYNKHNDLITEKSKNESSPIVIKTFKYVYDKENNWIERKEYENGKLIFTTKRQIEYE